MKKFLLVSLLEILKRLVPEQHKKTVPLPPLKNKEKKKEKIKKKRVMMAPKTNYFSALRKAALVVSKGILHLKSILPLANAPR